MSRGLVKMKTPIFVALDVDSAEQALALAQQLQELVGGFKIGPRLVVPHGAYLIQKMAKLGPVFVDMKYLDIPNTMESAVRATFEAGATWATVHAWAGSNALQRLARCETQLNQQRPFQLLAVTILTSFSQESLPFPMNSQPLGMQVERLAIETERAGLSGLVSSAWELADLQRAVPTLFKVVPGIRMPDAAADDQARTLAPGAALGAGADALVIGRPIVEAKDPVKATEKILADLR